MDVNLAALGVTLDLTADEVWDRSHHLGAEGDAAGAVAPTGDLIAVDDAGSEDGAPALIAGIEPDCLRALRIDAARVIGHFAAGLASAFWANPMSSINRPMNVRNAADPSTRRLIVPPSMYWMASHACRRLQVCRPACNLHAANKLDQLLV